MLKSTSVWHLLLLALVTLLEGLALVSVILQVQLLPLGTFYPNIISVAIYLLPTLVGFTARHLESAIVLAVLPFWVMMLIYFAAYAPAYESELYQLGVLAQRVAFATLLLGLLGAFGWLLRRVTLARIVRARANKPVREPERVTVG